MDSIFVSYQAAIQQVFDDYIEFLGEAEDIQLNLVIGRERDRYLLVELGWENGYRIYGTVLHIDNIDNKLWIQHDETEEGIADELVALGIPKQQIVLGFKPIERRKITEFAIN
ncbi:MAG: XisI protein [Symploca sp. SIO2D2]|nr:XisI protein [Symploca sp. SIO2D2]